jgi:phage tail-like protein
MPDNANPGNRKAPFAVYYFAVEIAGVEYPFQSVSGLTMESTVVEVQEGGFNQAPRKLIGPAKIVNIVLKKGFCFGDSGLYKLRLKFMTDLPTPATQTSGSAGKGWKGPNRFSGTITQKGPRGTEAKWFFVNGWIAKWSGPDLDASKNEISIETIEIAHEGLFMIPMAGADSGDSGDAADSSDSGDSSSGDSSSGDSSSGDSSPGDSSSGDSSSSDNSISPSSSDGAGG